MKAKDEMSKHRLKLHMKVMGPSSQTQARLKEDKPTYKEKFVPPEVSIISYFMTKVRLISPSPQGTFIYMRTYNVYGSTFCIDREMHFNGIH